MPFTPFDPKSPRARAGLKFQDEVLEKLKVSFPEIKFEMTWDFFKNQNPDLTNRELAIIEKQEGDITYLLDGQRHFIECCFAMGKKLSRLCEMKRRSFIGQNKWYCYGFAHSEEIIFIPSFTWKNYTGHIEKADKSCRMIPLKNIKSINAGCNGITEYWQKAHGGAK